MMLLISFGQHKSTVHNDEVFDAFYSFLGRTIPAFVSKMINRFIQYSQSELISAIQAAGINLRLLGFVRALIKCASSVVPAFVSAKVAP
jgi:hypothetical protein